MSTYNIGFYEDLTKFSFNYHQICTSSLLLDQVLMLPQILVACMPNRHAPDRKSHIHLLGGRTDLDEHVPSFCCQHKEVYDLCQTYSVHNTLELADKESFLGTHIILLALPHSCLLYFIPLPKPICYLLEN